MKLVEFSVTNYRSITSANKIQIEQFTVLVGKNNEGKSNLLMALDVAMNAVINHSLSSNYKVRSQYQWDRDFPVQLRNRKSGLQSIFKLKFQLSGSEVQEFHKKLKLTGNEIVPIEVKIGKDNKALVSVPKRGSSSYNKKSEAVTNFISERINYNYIQAVRTDRDALYSLENILYGEIRDLEKNDEYIAAIKKVEELQVEIYKKIGRKIQKPMKDFLPNIKSVELTNRENINLPFPRFMSGFDIIIDDGVPTSLSLKGDGIKSLVALSMLKDRRVLPGASIIAIEEPESHLHSGAIHRLADVINGIASNNQVIITTHNPLMVQQNNISSNIIVDGNTARPAKNISEIRELLGVWTSDNLRNARYVLVVEGEDDKENLAHILSIYNPIIGEWIRTNKLAIKPLHGAANLLHELNDLKNSMCKYIVLLDNDEEGKRAGDIVLSKSLIHESALRYTICNNMKESEFEDCVNPKIYENAFREVYQIELTKSTLFRNNKKKWSDRVKDVFQDSGIKWTDRVKKDVKEIVSNSIKATGDVDVILIKEKSGFINGVTKAIENLLVDN